MANARQLMAARSAWSDGAKKPYDYECQYHTLIGAVFDTGMLVKSVTASWYGENFRIRVISGTGAMSVGAQNHVLPYIFNSTTECFLRYARQTARYVLANRIGSRECLTDRLYDASVVNNGGQNSTFTVDGNTVGSSWVRPSQDNIKLGSSSNPSGILVARLEIESNGSRIEWIPVVANGKPRFYDVESDTLVAEPETGEVVEGPKA